MSEGGRYDPAEPGNPGALDKHGNVNLTATDAPSSKLEDGDPTKTNLAHVEKYGGMLPSVTAFVPSEESLQAPVRSIDGRTYAFSPGPGPGYSVRNRALADPVDARPAAAGTLTPQRGKEWRDIRPSRDDGTTFSVT